VARRTGKGAEIRAATPAAWDRFGPSASPADTGLGVQEPAGHRGGAIRQLVHNLARPVHRAATSGSATPNGRNPRSGKDPL